MTKLNLINRIARRNHLPSSRAQLLVDTVFAGIEEALRRGERVEIRGLGSFEVRRYQGYLGRNPRSGAAVGVKPKRLPFFRAGQEIAQRLNERLPATRALPAIGEKAMSERPALPEVAPPPS